MRKTPLFILILSFFILAMGGVAYSWQGRMGGMGDPFGLVEDESDFLIHPAAIANGKGRNFYSDYRFTWNDVGKWNSSWTGTVPSDPGCSACHQSFRIPGNEQKHEGLLGAAFPLGPGRMGLFLQYTGKRGDFKGDGFDELDLYPSARLRSDLDSFALRLLYGLPMGAFKLGGEVQLAYHHEKNETSVNYGYEFDKNYADTSILDYPETLPFLFPYDSKYWEALLKGSLKGAIGPAKIAFTLKGGFIFSGKNKLAEEDYYSSGDYFFNTNDGKVKGWSLGGDLWVRYPLTNGLSLPFLLKVGYQSKTRDADGPEFWNGAFIGWNQFKIEEKYFNVEVGGGIDKEIVKGTRVAAGIYYNYLNNKNSLSVFDSDVDGIWLNDNNSFPDQTEHRIILRLSGERELSPMVAMRMGLNFFYGWVKEDYKSTTGLPDYDGYSAVFYDKISMDGSRWGIGASVGGTVKFQQFNLEPFLGGGYQKLKLDGDGSNPTYAQGSMTYDMNKTKSGWFIGGGFSIKF